MAALHIIFDPSDRLTPTNDEIKHLGIKVAILPLADGLEGKDIYTVARQLAEMLLEQLK